MPLKKTAPIKQQNEERRLRAIARREALIIFGEKALRGKQVHHKNGNNKDNSIRNLSLVDIGSHGKNHGRGHGKRGALNIKK